MQRNPGPGAHGDGVELDVAAAEAEVGAAAVPAAGDRGVGREPQEAKVTEDHNLWWYCRSRRSAFAGWVNGTPPGRLAGGGTG